MEWMETVKKRRSVRLFQKRPIPEEAIRDMLEAARLAPSGGNGQSHRFGVVDDPGLIDQLAHAAGNQMWIATAPLVFACCADLSWDIGAADPDDFGLKVNQLRFGKKTIDSLSAFSDRRAVAKLLQNAAPLIPAEHIFLTAVSYGLQACFIGNLDVDRAGEILGLPDEIACLFLLPVGYPAQETACAPKKSVEEISFRNRWNKF